MLQFILTDILLLSLGGIIFLVLRALPRIEPEVASPEKRNLLERWILSEMPEKIDRFLNNVFFKLFRRFKIWLLKIDNTLTERLKHIKPINGDTAKPDFKDMMNGSEVAKSDDSGDNKK